MSNGSASSPEALVGLIDNLLKSASPPPDEVLRKVAKTLSQARGGTSQQTLSSTLISSSGGRAISDRAEAAVASVVAAGANQ